MAKPRVYELAKVLNVDSKTVLEKLKDMGEFVKSASSTIEPPVAPASEGRVRQGQRQGRFQARAAAPPGRTFGPGFHFIFRTDSGRLPHVRHRLPRHISRLRLRVHRHRVRRAVHAPGMPTPGRHGQNDNRENGRDNREGRENGRQSRPERSP